MLRGSPSVGIALAGLHDVFLIRCFTRDSDSSQPGFTKSEVEYAEIKESLADARHVLIEAMVTIAVVSAPHSPWLWDLSIASAVGSFAADGLQIAFLLRLGP
ncbi:MAG: hypothetical protein QOG61_115, partial [Candidatus Binataceae bacterium]|jgi:hypothetical protein|nr:hypothetical protein [Candidatus Binataceae bacterium]